MCFSQAVTKTSILKKAPKSSFTPVGKDNYRAKHGHFYAEKSDSHIDGPWEFGKRPLMMTDSEDKKKHIAEKNALVMSTPLD